VGVFGLIDFVHEEEILKVARHLTAGQIGSKAIRELELLPLDLAILATEKLRKLVQVS